MVMQRKNDAQKDILNYKNSSKLRSRPINQLTVDSMLFCPLKIAPDREISNLKAEQANTLLLSLCLDNWRTFEELLRNIATW